MRNETENVYYELISLAGRVDTAHEILEDVYNDMHAKLDQLRDQIPKPILERDGVIASEPIIVSLPEPAIVPVDGVVPFAGWNHPLPALYHDDGKIEVFVSSSGFNVNGSGPNKSRNHGGEDYNIENDPFVRGPRNDALHEGRYHNYWGVPLIAMGPGEVARIDNDADDCNITLDHGFVPGFGPLAVYYQHVARDSFEFDVGDEFQAGDVLCYQGNTTKNPNGTSVHLHVEMWKTFDLKKGDRGKKASGWRIHPKPILDRLPMFKAAKRSKLKLWEFLRDGQFHPARKSTPIKLDRVRGYSGRLDL